MRDRGNGDRRAPAGLRNVEHFEQAGGGIGKIARRGEARVTGDGAEADVEFI